MKRFFLLVISSLLLLSGVQAWPGSNPNRVVLQAFWWDYWNNNYPNGWYNYLTELAPRMKSMGINAVWIPPTSKGGGGTGDVGYGIFDHYDLGDKYQKGNVKTRLGTKDEYLRMVAVMHANGIDVIQDVVLNHCNGTGGYGANEADDKGGKDPNAQGNQWKNFRYVSYTTPVTTESKSDYLNRKGRWFKDWQNFTISGSGAWGINDYNYPLHGEMFGPDISYSNTSVNTNGARSTAATYGIATLYDPNQSAGYMKQQAIEWGVWMKKQTGIDGVRLDATKHFEWDVTEAFLYNLQFGTGLYGSMSTWANGGDNMWAVAEYIPEGGQPSMESHIDGVQGRTGTFDFNLRDAIYSVVNADGFADISTVPGGQINSSYRNRTVNFINNHDTFRPYVDASGNYTGWDVAHELRTHIDPFGRLVPAAYALATAVDGSVQVFFEDLFNVGGTSKRYSHLPTNTTDLPVRAKISNIIWAKRAIAWETGAYKVRSSEAGVYFNPGSTKNDLIAIERSGKAVIGVNDNGASDQSCWIDTDFPAGTQLKDYSGNTGYTYTVDGSKRIQVIVPKAVKDAQGIVTGGYVIIAPVGYDGVTFNPAQRTTTQEWEMADDLGDSHASSLKQGGALPASSAALRIVGRVFSETGKSITVVLTPSNATKNLTVALYNSAGTSILSTKSGTGTLTLTYTPTATGYYMIKVKNSSTSNPSQKVWVKATYTAPQTVNTALYTKSEAGAEETESAETEVQNQFSLEPNYPNPFNPSTTLNFTLPSAMKAQVVVYNALGQQIAVLADREFAEGKNSVEFSAGQLSSGVYFYQVITPAGSKTGKMMLMK